MSESSPKTIETPKIETKKETTTDEVEKFFDRESEILGAYGLRGDIALERGDGGWAFDYENRRLIYDPNFFIERGYNLKETLFATTHELMAHYGELLRDPELWLKEWRRVSTKSHLHILNNIFEDVLGNRRIVAEMPFLEETRTKLYKEKSFPSDDYRENASHVQFAYGFIREAMVPDESVQLSAEARQALDKLRSFGPDKVDVLDLVTTPSIEPKDRFKIMRNIIEPIYLSLYKEDVEQEKKKGSKGKEGKEGSGQGKTGESSKKEKGKWWQTKKKKAVQAPKKKKIKKNHPEKTPKKRRKK